jgi:hypothetical protein
MKKNNDFVKYEIISVRAFIIRYHINFIKPKFDEKIVSYPQTDMPTNDDFKRMLSDDIYGGKISPEMIIIDSARETQVKKKIQISNGSTF